MFAKFALLDFALLTKIKPFKIFQHLVESFSSFFIKRSQRTNYVVFTIDSKQRLAIFSSLLPLNDVSLTSIFFLICQACEEKLVTHSEFSSFLVFSLFLSFFLLNFFVNILHKLFFVV